MTYKRIINSIEKTSAAENNFAAKQMKIVF